MKGLKARAASVLEWFRYRFGLVAALCAIAVMNAVDAGGLFAQETDPWTTAIPAFGFSNPTTILTKVSDAVAPVLVTLFLGSIGLGIVYLIWRMVRGFASARG
jgi:hypothetical protein